MNGTQGTSIGKTVPGGASQQKSFILGTIGELKECRPSPESVTDLWASSGLFLKPVTKVSITVTIPFVKGKEGSRVVSNNEVIANIKKLVTPREFLTLKICKETNTFLRYIGEIEEKKDLPIFVSKLNGSFIQLKSFGNDAVFKLNAAEYDVIVPKQKDWVNHFAKMIGSDEDKPGMRPDTLVITGLPCAWFSNYHKDKQRTLKEFERKRVDRKKRKMIKNRRRQRGSSVSSSTGNEGGFGSSSTDSAEEEEKRKREQQKKILLQFQTGDYQNTEEGKSFVHTKNEVHKILRVDPEAEGTASREKIRRAKSKSESRSRSSRSYSRSRSDSRSRSRSYSSSSGSRRSISSRSSASESSYRRKNRIKRRRKSSSTSEKKKPDTKKPAMNMWKKNTFTNVEEPPGNANNESVQNGLTKNASEKEKGAEDSTSYTEEMKNKEAKRKARKEFKRRPWINLPVPEVPEESMIRRVFELFGRVRKIEVPLLKEVADQNSKYKKRSSNSVGIGVFNFETFAAQSEAANVTSFKTFVVYIQYETYLGFTVAMNALRGKRLYYKDLDDRAYICTFKVDFDGNGYLSDRKIKQRKVERFKQLHKDEIENEQPGYPCKKGRRDSSRKRSSKGVYASETNLLAGENQAKSQNIRTRHAFRGAEYFNEDGSQVSRKRRSLSKYGTNALRRKREKIAFPMPDKVLPKSILHEKSESHVRTTKSLSFVGPELPDEKKRDGVKDEDARKRDLSELTDISSEEEEDEPNGLASNTEIDRLLKEALKVKNGRKRRLVVLELLRRLQAAKESRVYLVAKRKAQAVILVHAIFERIKNAENVIMERHVEMLEEVRRKQIEQEKSLKEECARKEALRALKQHQKMQSKEVKLREKMVKRVMRCKDKEDLDRREKLRKQVAAATLAAEEGGEDAEQNPLVLKSTALREARHSVRRHGFKPDMVGHLEDKAVGYTAPENYSNYVEYMKEKRPNFVGSAVVTSFSVVEETPQRADVIRSCVVPKQLPVPAPLEEIIKNKKFETDSESSCDEVGEPQPPLPAAEPRKISYARTHLAFIKSGSRKEKRSKRTDLDESQNQTENDSEGFKVPLLPVAYRNNENDATTLIGLNEKVDDDKNEELKSDSYESLSDESSEHEMRLPEETNAEIEKAASESVTENLTEDNERTNNLYNNEALNDPRPEQVRETTKSPDKMENDPPQKRRNAVEDSIMDDVNKMGYCLNTGIDAGRSTDTQTLSGLESQSDNEERKSSKNDVTQKGHSEANDSSEGEYSEDESSGSYDGSTSTSEEGELSEDENHEHDNSTFRGGGERKCSEKTETVSAKSSEPALESKNNPQQKITMENVSQENHAPEPQSSYPAENQATNFLDGSNQSLQNLEKKSASESFENNSTDDKIEKEKCSVEENRKVSDREAVDISSESDSGDGSYSGSSSESGSLSESEGEIDE